MFASVRGKVKEIKENGIILDIEEEDIFISNSYNDYIYDFNKLELMVGDPIRALGTVIWDDDDSDHIVMFKPAYIANVTPRKFIPPLDSD